MWSYVVYAVGTFPFLRDVIPPASLIQTRQSKFHSHTSAGKAAAATRDARHHEATALSTAAQRRL